jgi:hypothetical protein
MVPTDSPNQCEYKIRAKQTTSRGIRLGFAYQQRRGFGKNRVEIASGRMLVRCRERINTGVEAAIWAVAGGGEEDLFEAAAKKSV